jgi:hypothetical protein
MTTTKNYRIHVMILDRKDPIVSAVYTDKNKAEADLQTISEARLGKTDLALPWIQFAGDQVQGAFIEEGWDYAPSAAVWSPDLRTQQF